MPDNHQPSKESVEAAKRFVSSHGTCLTGYSTFEGEADFELAVAAFYDEAYRRGRESMREEAAREMGYMAGAQMKARAHCEDSSTKEIFLRVAKAFDVARDAIRSLPLTEVKK